MPITKAVIIHGSGGSAQGNWFPWLKEELEKQHISVILPQFPIDEEQTLANWMSEFGKWSNSVDKDTIIVAHSLGPAFALNLLERNGCEIAAAFFVAPFIGKLGIERIDNGTKTFVNREFDWNKIKAHCKAFYIYSSDDDPFVPLEKGEFLSAKLNARFKIIHGGGHLNEKFGYTKFPLLLSDIKAFISSTS